MMSLDGLILISLVVVPILYLACFVCGLIYSKYGTKKPTVALVICVAVVVISLYGIYFISGYGADVGWWVLPPPSNLTTNVTLTLKV